MINVKSHKPTFAHSTTYDGDMESDPRINKKNFNNEKDQFLDWEFFKENNGKMLIVHDILIHKILSHIQPITFDEIRFILRVDYLIDNPTVDKLISFLPNSRFIEFEKADKDEQGTSLRPIVYLRPRQIAPSGPHSLWIPPKS